MNQARVSVTFFHTQVKVVEGYKGGYKAKPKHESLITGLTDELLGDLMCGSRPSETDFYGNPCSSMCKSYNTYRNGPTERLF